MTEHEDEWTRAEEFFGPGAIEALAEFLRRAMEDPETIIVTHPEEEQ